MFAYLQAHPYFFAGVLTFVFGVLPLGGGILAHHKKTKA